MYLDVADKGLSQDLIMDGTREVYFVETVKKEVKAEDIVVDIGANIGYYALLEARIVGDKGRVYAIEPVTENIGLLRKNIELNGYTNIEVYQLAIGDKKGLATMYIPKERNLSAMKHPDSYTGIVEERSVEVTTLDDFLKNKPYPNVIRMDVEGYEYQIIKGMKKTLGNNYPLTILVELHFSILKKEESTEILQTLRKAGFEIADVTFESRIRGFSNHKSLWRIASLVEIKRLHAPPFGHLELNTDDIISNTSILNGDWGALEICFKRLQQRRI